MRTHTRLLITLLALLGLVAAGCGGDDDDDTGGADTTDDAGTDATDEGDTGGDSGEGEAADGEATDGEATDGEATDGEATDGEATDGGAAAEYVMEITIDEPAEYAGTYDLTQLDPGLSSYVCFVGNGSGVSLQLAGITGQALGFMTINSSEGVIDGPGTLPATGQLQTPEFDDLFYFEGEVVVESVDDVGSSGTFTLEAGDNSGNPPASGSWSCGPA